MTVALVVGICVIMVVWGLISGNGGRLMIAAAIIVGWGVHIAQTLAGSGTNLLTNIGDLVARLGGAL